MIQANQLPQPQRKITQSISKGFKRALNPLSVLYPTLNELRNDFFTLNTEEARRAFAARWVTLLRPRLEESWQIFYELLRLIQKYELYTDLPKRWDPVKCEYERAFYADFKAFFEAEIKQPFAVFQELEQTYRLLTENAPELLQLSWCEDTPGTAPTQKRAQDAAPAITTGGLPREDDPAPRVARRNMRLAPAAERARARGVSVRTQYKLDYLGRHDQTYGTSYLDQVHAGTLSVSKAYQQARDELDKTPGERLRYWWIRANPTERRRHAEAILAWLQAQDGESDGIELSLPEDADPV
jgi:hypothetical protein